LAIDSQDRLYALTRGPHPVIIFGREGNVVDSWGENFFSRAHGICIGPDDTVYCADDFNHTVSKFTPQGELLMVLGNKDKASDTGYCKKNDLLESLATIKRAGEPFNRPTGIALSSSGDIYVSDGYGNARIHKFSPDGKLLFSWGNPGSGLGQFLLPHLIETDTKDNVWVADRENRRIQIFDDQGKFLYQWTDLDRPTDVAFDGEGVVYISELEQRVSIFSKSSDLLSRWGSQGKKKDTALFAAPHTIAIDSRGDIYVGEVAKTHVGIDKGSRVLQKFTKV
jgi:hypothetical protein